jgi:sugar phosphate isomerase/epimerase
MVHVKDRLTDGTMVDVGDGNIDFPAIFADSEEAGIKHYFVEHDQPEEPLESIRRSYEYLSG